jgi:DNA repair ATPase RecN
MFEQKSSHEVNVRSDHFNKDVENVHDVVGCCKVTKRRDEYETRIATEQGLIKLGNDMSKNDNDVLKRGDKYSYLLAYMREMEEFNEFSYFNMLQKCDTVNTVIHKAQILIGHITKSREMYNHQIEDITKLNNEILLLKSENEDMADMADGYIHELDEAEKKIEKYKTDVEKYKTDVEKNNIKMIECSCIANKYREKICQLDLDCHNLRTNEKLDRAEILQYKTARRFVMLTITYGVIATGLVLGVIIANLSI